MNHYLHGIDCLGAEGGQQQYVVIRVKNVPELVRKQGGTPGSLAQSFAPQSVENMVYARIRDGMLVEFKKQGVDADVQVTTSPPKGSTSWPDLGTGVAIGASVYALGRWLFNYLGRSK